MRLVLSALASREVLGDVVVRGLAHLVAEVLLEVASRFVAAAVAHFVTLSLLGRRCGSDAALLRVVRQQLTEHSPATVQAAHDRADRRLHDVGAPLAGEAFDLYEITPQPETQPGT